MTEAEPLYVVRDGALQTQSEPMSRVDAGRLATERTLEAGRKGEAVAVRGIDRFTVARAAASDLQPARPAAPTYTALEMEAALCIWEAMLDARLESTLPAMDAAWDATAAGHMRQLAVTLAPFALQVFDALPASIREGAYGFDYHVIPAVLAQVIWVGSGYVLPPVETAARDVAETLTQDA